MDDIDQCKYESDSEMLDDAAEQTCFAAVHSPTKEAHTVDTDMSLDEIHLFEPVASAADSGAYSQSSAPG